LPYKQFQKEELFCFPKESFSEQFLKKSLESKQPIVKRKVSMNVKVLHETRDTHKESSFLRV